MQDKEEDSFEAYKKYLQDSIGVTGVKVPPRPMSPYQRYLFERIWQQKSKGNNMRQANKLILQEWKDLPQAKKQYYIKTHQIRTRQREELQKQYQILTKKKKPTSAYMLFFKKQYQHYKQINNQLTSAQLNRKISQQWKSKTMAQRQKYNKEAMQQNALCQLNNQQRQERIQEYNNKVVEFENQIKEEKDKIMKKYGCDRKMEGKKRREEKLREKEERREKKEKKEKQKQEKKKEIKKQGSQKKDQVKKQTRTQRQVRRQLKNLTAQLKVEVKIQPTLVRITRSSK